MHPKKQSENIQKYLAGELKGSELDDFKKAIQESSTLQEDILLHNKVDQAIVNTGLEKFKKQLDIIHKENKRTRCKNIVHRLTPWHIAAAALIIFIVIAALSFLLSDSVKPHEIFEKYYAPYEVNVSRSFETGSEIFDKGLESYAIGNYELAFLIFETVSQADRSNIAVHLYKGICGIELGKYETAEKEFEIIIKAKDPFYLQDAEWYMALLMLKMEDVDAAGLMFKNIAENNGFYAEKALLVLERF